MADDLARAFAFMARADMGGARTEPFRYGTAVFMDDLPLRHDSNYLLVARLPAGVGAEELAAEADRVQGRTGLEHRALVVPDEAAGRRLEAGFTALGWNVHRHLVMDLRRAPDRVVDIRLVQEVDDAALRAGRERQILDEPWGTPEVARQLLDAKRRIAQAVRARFFAVVVDGEAVSWGDLYSDGVTAQVEDVATLPEHRGRGYASAVVMRAVAEALDEGAGFVFLVADDEDWPKELYRRLGFDDAGRYYKFIRTTSGRPDGTPHRGRTA